jgi:hypothetical protein
MHEYFTHSKELCVVNRCVRVAEGGEEEERREGRVESNAN